jgi:hypothetical protein
MALALFHLIMALSMKWILVLAKESFSSKKGFIVETPIPKAERSGIGKLNNPAKRRV